MQCLQFRKRGSLLPKILHLLIIIFPASTRKYVTSSARSPLAISKFASLGIGQGRGKQNGKGVQECSHSFIMWFCIDGRLQCLAVNMLDIWRERKSQKGSSFVRIGKQVVGRRYHCKSPLVHGVGKEGEEEGRRCPRTVKELSSQMPFGSFWRSHIALKLHFISPFPRPILFHFFLRDSSGGGFQPVLGASHALLYIVSLHMLDGF